jgi:hypothetical protein
MAVYCKKHKSCGCKVPKTPMLYKIGARVYADITDPRTMTKERICGLVVKRQWQNFVDGFGPLMGRSQWHWYYHMKYVDHPRAANGDQWAWDEEGLHPDPLDALARIK